ncbi:hypothetical protein ACV2MU_002585 [Klebsiella pneumoniae]
MKHLAISIRKTCINTLNDGVSIGAVFFEPQTGKTFNQFYQLEMYKSEGLDLPIFLIGLETFIIEHSKHHRLVVWGYLHDLRFLKSLLNELGIYRKLIIAKRERSEHALYDALSIPKYISCYMGSSKGFGELCLH